MDETSETVTRAELLFTLRMMVQGNSAQGIARVLCEKWGIGAPEWATYRQGAVTQDVYEHKSVPL